MSLYIECEHDEGTSCRWCTMPSCPEGCGCRLGTEDPDRLECGCDGPCNGDAVNADA